ncbi:hypothetical protein [Streptomyces sp. CBMA152]|uniref:hypothetical protein n=1 Tax=Streptomyces sp. CBMA152 TaxID=1896312 RepID=UPI0016612358|nr:hypothetical protein [Streptomyces sp. CBMA152]MBD0743578.1 hypothetical protein [Streptomyces sp. CBMA152]
MTTPRWGHKPAPVADRYAYWSDAPPAPSDRAVYWIRRWREGTWRPNRWLLRECYDCRSSMLGIWIWESRFVLHSLDSASDKPVSEVAAVAVEWSNDPLGPYWRELEMRTRPEDGGDDLIATLAGAMQAAVPPPAEARHPLARW